MPGQPGGSSGRPGPGRREIPELIQNDEAKRHVTAELPKMSVESHQDRAGVAGGQRDEDIVLQSGKTDGFVIGKDALEQPPSVEPAGPPGRGLDRRHPRHQPFDCAPRATTAAAQEFAGHYG